MGASIEKANSATFPIIVILRVGVADIIQFLSTEELELARL